MAKQTFTVGQVLTATEMTSLQQTAMGGGSTTAKTASYVLVAADAGTVVQMNAAGATTITVNTALFAAGDTVQIQNVGAGVCTVTAGTATVSTAGSLALSQYEGGQLYFNTTSAALFFDIVQSSGMTNPMTTTGDIIYSSSGSTPARLGIGTTGQVVTVASGLPSWATPASGGKVLQVVTATYTTLKSIATTTMTDTDLTCNITPTLATSRVLVLVTQLVNTERSAKKSNVGWQVMRGATVIAGSGSTAAFGPYAETLTSPVTGLRGILSASYLDSPATTSATTYKTQGCVEDTANSAVANFNQQGTSAIVLLEIGA